MVVKLGWATQTSIKILVASLVSGTISASISPSGSVDVTQYTDRHGGGNFIGVGYVTFSGLSAGKQYTYTIASGTEAPISGSFTTAPADYRCAFIVSTCDSDMRRTTHRPFTIIKDLALKYASKGVPFAQLHVDDVNYVDGMKVNIAGWPTQTYKCESEAQSKYYARAWAATFGLFAEYPKWSKDPDRLWCNQNVPWHGTVGDHGFASNFRRGPSLVGGSDYYVNEIAADGKSWTEAQIEAAALPEVQAWISAIGAPVARAGELYSSASYGPAKIFFSDVQLHSTAWSGTPDPGPMFGSQQIADMMSALDVSTHPLKILAIETSVSKYGQSWQERYPTEANAWHADLITRANLNGTSGHFFVVRGDTHVRQVVSFTYFWEFVAGVLQDSQSVLAYQVARNQSASLAFGGKLRWSDGCIVNTGDNHISGFWLFDAFSDHIEARYIDGANGNILYGPVQLVYAQTGNQWQKMISPKTT